MKRALFIVVVVVSILIIKNLAFSIYGLWQKQDVLISAKKELEQEKKKNEDLKKKLSLVDKNSYIEQEARNKLLLVKPGESIVVLPASTSSGLESDNREYPEKSNWQQWIELFFAAKKRS